MLLLTIGEAECQAEAEEAGSLPRVSLSKQISVTPPSSIYHSIDLIKTGQEVESRPQFMKRFTEYMNS